MAGIRCGGIRTARVEPATRARTGKRQLRADHDIRAFPLSHRERAGVGVRSGGTVESALAVDDPRARSPPHPALRPTFSRREKEHRDPPARVPACAYTSRERRMDTT